MGSEDDAGEDVDRWVAEARADEAIAERVRQWWRRRAAEETATLAGVLADLAEAGRPVTVQTVSGRRHRGRLEAVGADVAVVRTDDGRVLVPLAALALVLAAPGDRLDPTGDREPAGEATLAGVLADHVGDEVVLVVVGDPSPLRGWLASAGADVVSVRLDRAGRTAVVPVHSLSEVLLASTG